MDINYSMDINQNNLYIGFLIDQLSGVIRAIISTSSFHC